MTAKITWICDGCDEELVVSGQQGEPLRTRDWKPIIVTIEGFSGYPVSEGYNGTKRYELCPSCQRHVSTAFFPRIWPRKTKAATSGQ